MATIKKTTPAKLTARQFIADLQTFQSEEEWEQLQRCFKTGEGQYSEGDVFMG